MNAIAAQMGSCADLNARIHSGEFLDGIRTGIMLFDANGAAFDCNQAVTMLLGFTLDELRDHTSYNMPVGAVRDDGSPLPGDEFASAIVLRTGEPCYGVMMGVNNPGQQRRWLSVDGYPLIVDGQVKGAAVWFDDVSDLRQQRRSLELLTEVNRFVMSVTGEIDPLQLLCDALVEFGPYSLAWIGRPSIDEPLTVDVAFAAGATDYPYEGMVSSGPSKDTGLGPVGTALRTGVTEVIGDLTEESLVEPWRERAATFNLHSCVAIPFAPAGQKMVLAVYDQHVFAFDEATVMGMEAIAREIEFAIGHLRSVAQLEEALERTLSSLGYMTEIRDPYTSGHQTRVGYLGAAIATHLGLDVKMIDLIRQSGDVHDIGKIAIPAEILNRPGRLSALEYEMVKGHTTVGFEILSKASLPWPIAEVALSHHERLDGSGYPSGLLAGQIILPARIIAVADVVEAMTQHRPYRPALGLKVALAEVVKGAGTLFDREVVESCLAVFDLGFTFESLSTADVLGIG